MQKIGALQKLKVQLTSEAANTDDDNDDDDVINISDYNRYDY